MDDLEQRLEWEEYSGSGSFVHHMIAGSAAGVSEHVVMFPLDTYKTHLQFSRGSLALSFSDLVRSGGLLRMWRGAPAVAAACIPSHAAYFSAYEWGKEAFGANGEGHRPVAAAAAGAVATLLHDAVLTPMDVVKQRLQLGYYRGIRHCVTSMVREEGALAFFRSYPTTLAMNVPYAAVAVATNESLKRLLSPSSSSGGGGGPGLWTYLVAGAGAGAVAAAVTCPLDVLKTRLQTASLVAGDGGAGGGGGAAASAGGASAASAGAAQTPPGGADACRGGPGRAFPAATAAASSGAAPPRAGSGGPSLLSRGPPPLQQLLQRQVAMLYTTAGRRASPPASALGTARAILAEEGPGAFFKGAGARVLVHTPSMAISWSTYEFVKGLLLRHDPLRG